MMAVTMTPASVGKIAMRVSAVHKICPMLASCAVRLTSQAIRINTAVTA